MKCRKIIKAAAIRRANAVLAAAGLVHALAACGILAQPPMLQPDQTVEGEVGAEGRNYRLEMQAGEAVHLILEQLGTDLVLTVASPSGQVQASDRADRHQMKEQVWWVADATGGHEITINAKSAPSQGETQFRLTVGKIQTEPDTLSRFGQLTKAAHLTQESLRLEREEEKHAEAVEVALEAEKMWLQLQEPVERAQNLSWLARLAFTLSQLDRSEQSAQAALRLWTELGNRYEQAYMFQLLGSIAFGRFAPQQAVEPFEKALLLADKDKDLSLYAIIRFGLGTVLLMTDVSRGLKLLHEARESFSEAGDCEMEKRTLGQIMLAYGALRAPERVEEYEQALARLQEDCTASLPTGIIEEADQIKIELSHLSPEQKDFQVKSDQLLARIESHLERVREVLPQSILEGEALLFKGTLLLEKKRFQRALETLLEAEESWRKLAGSRLKLALWTHPVIGHAYLKLDMLDAAEERFRQLLRQEQGDNLTGRALSFLGLARVHHRRNQFLHAEEMARAAIDIRESIRHEIPGPSLRAAYTATTREFYETYLKILIEQPRSPARDGKIWKTSEEARARSLYEILRQPAADRLRQRVPSPLDRRRRIQEQIAAAQVELFRARSDDSSADGVRELQEKLRGLHLERHELDEKTWTRDTLHMAEPELPLSQVRERLLDEHSALLEYFLGFDAAYLFVVTQEDFTVLELNDRQAIRQQEKLFFEALRHGGRSRRGAYALFGRSVFDILVEPAAKFLQGKTRLIVVPDAELHRLAFQALLTDGAAAAIQQLPYQDWPFLVKRFEVQTTPSAAVLDTLSSRPRPTSSPHLTVFADPDYPDTDTDPFQSGGRWRLPRFQHGREEVKRLKQTLEGTDWGFTPLVGPKVRESNLKQHLDVHRATHLHISVHGVADDRSPDYSRLIFPLPEAGDGGEDGLFQVFEVWDQAWEPQVVVLSACDTGRGPTVRGEGVMSLSRAFLSRSPSVVMTLWGVLERPSIELLVRFYHYHVREKRDVGESLRKAQLELIAQDALAAEPHYWAAFTLHGRS
ncbi:MAG TPA: CHAT domain-containing tetratricopeptide repeat protein [Acidobacteriota bacterium]|nr:CHAT domain-containing tetratricopeptide repeat protein [Acidobacteriota bacterium]